jgi:cytochrome P450
MMQCEDVQIASSAFKADPFAFYARLRAKKPVCAVMLPTMEKAWLVARYDDVSRLLKDPRLAKDPVNAMTPAQLALQPRVPGMFAPLTRNMLGIDDPDHTRLKRLVQAAFTPRQVGILASRTEEIAETLLDGLKRRVRFDLVTDFAMPLPVTVISELLGVPEADRISFARWSHTLLSTPLGSWRIIFSLPDILRFMRYLRKLVALKREKPGDDLVSALVAFEGDAEKLTGDELLAMIAILLSAGHETTANLIGNGTLALMLDKEALERLKAEPSLIDTAVEELLRFAGPVATSTFRYAREDMEIAGTPVLKGDMVLGAIASANRDRRQFADPDRLDLARTPNRHLTFGEGSHYCVGAALARMEARVAFTALLRHFPSLRLSGKADDLSWREGLVLRGLERLPVCGA